MVRVKRQLKVLITCGPTHVPIDNVRVISNVSSGELGHLIAQSLLRYRAKITLLEGPVTHMWQDSRVRRIKYRFFDELSQFFQQELIKSYDIVIHAAAVSDFEVKKNDKKLDSGRSQVLQLKPTLKLINLVKQLAPQSILVGFKLQTSLAKALKESSSLFKESKCNVVIANSFNEGYSAAILADNKLIMKINNKKVLADKLVNFLLTSYPAPLIPVK